MRPIHRSFADPSDEIYRENPAKCPETKCFSSGPNSGCQGRISVHWTTKALLYNIPRPSPHPSHPCKQCCGSGMFIPDPGPGFLPIQDPGSRSRIQKQQQKRGVKKNLLSHLFCMHKFHKIENYFSFEMLKKKIWANFQRIIGLFTQKIATKLPKIWVWDPGSEIRDLEKTFSGSRIQGSKRHWIPDPDPQHCLYTIRHPKIQCPSRPSPPTCPSQLRSSFWRIMYRKNPAKKSPCVISYWTSEAKKYNVPCHRSCADPTRNINDIHVEKTQQNVPIWQKLPKCTTAYLVQYSNCR